MRLSRRQIFLMALLAVLALLLGFVLRDYLRSDPPARSSSALGKSVETSRRILAYVAADEFALVVDGQVVSRASGDYHRRAPSWTNDGRYAFAIMSAAKSEAVVVIDRETLGTFTVPCPGCYSVVPVDQDDVLLVDGVRRIHRLDLAQGPDGRPVRIDTPITFSQQLTALAGLPELTLFAGADRDTTAAYGGPEELVLAHTNGQVRRIGQTVGNVGVSQGVSAAVTGYGGARMAYVTGGHFNACQTTESITVLDPTTATVASELHAPEPETPYWADGHGSSVLDLWWGEDRLLYATTQAWHCPSEPRLLGDPVLWRMEPEGTWIKVKGQVPTRSMRTSSGRIFANLAIAVDEQGYGPLIWFAGPDQKVINPKVLAIATPPF